MGQHVTLPSGRTYWLSGAGATLVVGLHGTSLSADNINGAFWSGTGGWQGHAAANGYRLALGEAVGGKWNVGNGWPGGGQDDMTYLLDLATDAASRGFVSRCFVAGFSAGGAMAWRAAAERPDVFGQTINGVQVGACGMDAGWRPVDPAGPLDCWHSHRADDTSIPIRGGAGTQGFTFPAAADEGIRVPRGSRWSLYVFPTGGHSPPPGWLAGRLWTFWTSDSARP